MESEKNTLDLVSLMVAGKRIGRTAKTLRNWMTEGKLRGDHGLYYVNNRPMIDWPVFAVAFIKRAP
jgi:hypothetical protein